MRTDAIIGENNLRWTAGWGNTEADIMVIASHPTSEDSHSGGIFTDTKEYSSTDEVMHALEVAGIKQEDCWFTSIVKYGLGSKDKPTSKQIEECAADLDEELNTIKPKLIISLGAEVFKRVMKQNIKQSDYLGEIVDSPYGKVLANYSPANVYRVDPKLRPTFIENFELAKRHVDGRLNYRKFNWLVITDPKQNTEILKYYMAKGCWTIGYDAEWKGKFLKDEKMYSFQYSCEPDKAIVLPLLNDKGEEDLELLNTMKIFLEHPKADRVGWNVRADDKRLITRGFKLADETLGFDGMKAVALFDSRWRKGLETGIKKFTNYKPYYNAFFKGLREHKLKKDEMAEMLFKDSALFYEYCAGDAASHREACVNMRAEMPKYVPAGVIKYYNEVYLPLTGYFTDMELTGIPIDMELLDSLTNQYQSCYDKLYKKLLDYTKDYGFETIAYEASEDAIGKEETQKLGLRPDFNPKSYLHRNYFFFDKLGLEPAYYVKKGKAKPKNWYDKAKKITQAQYSPSSNGKSMATIRFGLAEKVKAEPDNAELQKKYEIVSTYLDLARVSVFANKFLSKQGVADDQVENDGIDEEDEEGGDEIDLGNPLKSSYWAALANDKRIHADFYECLDNFRSSSKPNVQNPASKVLSHIPAIFAKCEMDAPKNVRNIFYSGHPDWYFAEVDVAGADLAIAAFLSKDKDYIHDIQSGGFHVTKMREYFNNPKLQKSEASKYVTAKSITFRVAYTAGLMSAAMPIQAEIYAENGNLVDIEVIKYALLTWERYQTYMQYREQCQSQVTNDKSIVNLRGMKFRFEETDDFGIKAGWMNQSLAYPIASELALFMWDISVQIKGALKRDNNWMRWCYPVNVVHDANYWLVHKDMMKDNYFPEICKNYFTDEVRIATGDALGIEMVVNDRWKGKEKIFDNETVWDFENKCWNWRQ